MVEDVAGIGKAAAATAKIGQEGVKQYGEVIKASIKEVEHTKRKKLTTQVERDTKFEKFQKQFLEKYIAAGQQAIIETRKSISDLSIPFYERSWVNKKGVVQKLKASPISMLFTGAAAYVLRYVKLANEARATGNMAEYQSSMNAAMSALLRYFVEPWENLVNNPESLRDIAATTAVSQPPPNTITVDTPPEFPADSGWNFPMPQMPQMPSLEGPGMQAALPHLSPGIYGAQEMGRLMEWLMKKPKDKTEKAAQDTVKQTLSPITGLVEMIK